MSEIEQFDQGAAAAVPEGPSVDERADTKAWFTRIDAARRHDENARKRYAVDRRYARGDRGAFEVGLPIAGSYIDILKSFLYARDPDLDCQPSDGTTPPPMADLLKKARQQVQADPNTAAVLGQAIQSGMAQASQQAAVGALSPDGQPMPPPDPAMAGQEAARSALEQMAKAEADKMMEPYRTRAADAKQLGQTLETVLSYVWRQAKLKTGASKVVGSGLTVGLGWLKATWQERRGNDPLIAKQIADLQDNLARLSASQAEYAAGECPDPEAARASIEQQIAGLQAQVEVVIARGLAIDFIPVEDIQVSPEVAAITDYCDAPWIAHRTFMGMDDAKATFPGVKDQLKNAATYYAKKPCDGTKPQESPALADVDARDADSYRVGSSPDGNDSGSVCVWEVWHKQDNMILTFIEGLQGYARAPYPPNPGTTRFYPFFQYAPVQCDGERHPQSLIARSESLLDDMNRLYSNRAEHRRRCIPKVGFDSTLYEPAEVRKMEAGGAGEMVGLKPSRPGEPIGNALVPLSYAGIDEALYDDSATRAMLEMTWGIQEALSSTIRTAKTATEAEIQQTGTQARTAYMRDCLDDMLSDLAQYTAEVSIQRLGLEDAKQIAGPWAFWPENLGIEGLQTLVAVQIRAGSSGKPDTTRRQEAWAAIMPVVQNAIVQVGQLRGSSPESMADCIEELVAETLQRSGEKLDPARFLPGAPEAGAAPAMQPAPMTPGAPQ